MPRAARFDKTGCSLSPHQARTVGGEAKAWWCESPRSIDIYVDHGHGHGPIAVVRVNRSEIIGWIERTKS